MCTYVLGSHIHQTNTLPSSHFQLCFLCCVMGETVKSFWRFCRSYFHTACYLSAMSQHWVFADSSANDKVAHSSSFGEALKRDVIRYSNNVSKCLLNSEGQLQALNPLGYKLVGFWKQSVSASAHRRGQTAPSRMDTTCLRNMQDKMLWDKDKTFHFQRSSLICLVHFTDILIKPCGLPGFMMSSCIISTELFASAQGNKISLTDSNLCGTWPRVMCISLVS